MPVSDELMKERLDRFRKEGEALSAEELRRLKKSMDRHKEALKELSKK